MNAAFAARHSSRFAFFCSRNSWRGLQGILEKHTQTTKKKVSCKNSFLSFDCVKNKTFLKLDH